MKYLALISITLFILNCATTYKPISANNTFAENVNSNEDIEISFGSQGLGKNNRFRDKFENEKIAFMRLTIKNKSDQIITINQEDVNLKIKDDLLAIAPLNPEIVYKRISLNTATYWLWGFLWIGTIKYENGEYESNIYPIGLVIGAINFFIARGTNNDMKMEIINNHFKGGSLLPGDEISGYLFYNSSQKRFYELQVNYSFKNGLKKLLSVPYSF